MRQKQIVVAFDKFEKATGSKDQSFMFEYKIENGKRVRTGKYITEKKARELPDAQRDFYLEMMRIKKEVDRLLPPSVLGERKIVMLRKTAMEKAREASDIGVKAKYMWEALRNTVVDTSESVDYDYYEVELDFQGNRVDKLPILYTKKGKKETYDDMTDDVASSILAYAGMANEYYQLNEIVGEIENASYMSAQRQITQRAGSKIQRQTVQNDDLIFHEDYTQPQSRTNIQKVFDDFKMMHVYGHLRRNEGTFGKTNISKRKTIDTINSVTSYSQLAVNLPQRIANVSVGQANILIHAAGKGAFNMKDILWATKQWMEHMGKRLLDTGASEDAKVKTVPLVEIQKHPFILIKRSDIKDPGKKKTKITELAKVKMSITGETTLKKYSKLGYKGKKGQVTVQYNPFINPAYAMPLMSSAEKENASKIKADEFMDASFGIAAAANTAAEPQTKLEASSRPTLGSMAGAPSNSAVSDKPTLAGMAGASPVSAVDRPTLNDLKGITNRHEVAAEKASANNEGVLSQHVEEIPGSFSASVEGAIDIPIDSQYYDEIYEQQRMQYAAGEDTSVDEQTNLSDLEEAGGDLESDSDDMPFEYDPWAGMTPTPEEAAAYNEEQTRKGMPSVEIAVEDGGEVKTKKFPISPWSVREARRQKAYVELNRRLRQILRNAGIGIGVITEAEARMRLAGITDFNTAKLTAEGLKELIRLAEGKLGEYALPEEFAHVAVEMLGREHPLVSRLLNALASDEAALREAFGNQYDWYMKYYEGNADDMLLEAAGKIVAKQLLYEQQIQSSGIRGLVRRIVDAIKSLLRKIGIRQIDDAILDSEGIASKLARDLLSGRLADEMSLDNIVMDGKMPNKERKDISDQKDAMTMLLKNELKRLSILQKRYAYSSKKASAASISNTEAQIIRLEAAIRDHKTTSAILTYLGHAYDFLKAAEESLDSAVGTMPANSICKKARVILDTIYSYKVATKIINDAVKSGEFSESPELKSAIDKMTARLAELLDKTNTVSLQLFQGTMADFYGEDGLDITIGKERGRHISIQEMTTHGDKDINIFSRWVHSMADTNDLVLKAISGIPDAKSACYG